MPPYHHGSLRPALVDTAVELARASGPEAVVLRAVTRAAGVSHNAAYRHFTDRDELLREVCRRCMAALATRMEATIDRDVPGGPPQERAWASLEATGRAYVEFALEEPGWFRTAFAVPRELASLQPGEGAGPAGRDPYQMLGDALDGLVTTGAVSAARRVGAEHAAWSAVHGLATLLVDGPLRELPADERDRALQTVLGVVSAGLAAPVRA